VEKIRRKSLLREKNLTERRLAYDACGTKAIYCGAYVLRRSACADRKIAHTT
jgi:hypothetical protein